MTWEPGWCSDVRIHRCLLSRLLLPPPPYTYFSYRIYIKPRCVLISIYQTKKFWKQWSSETQETFARGGVTKYDKDWQFQWDWREPESGRRMRVHSGKFLPGYVFLWYRASWNWNSLTFGNTKPLHMQHLICRQALAYLSKEKGTLSIYSRRLFSKKMVKLLFVNM